VLFFGLFLLFYGLFTVAPCHIIWLGNLLFISIECFYGFELVLIPEYSSCLKEHFHKFVRRNFNLFIT